MEKVDELTNKQIDFVDKAAKSKMVVAPKDHKEIPKPTAKELYWLNKGKKTRQFADCPSCKTRYYIKNIVSISKCNVCGYRKPVEVK